MVCIIERISFRITERDFTPSCNICNMYSSQAAATGKSRATDRGHAVGDGNGGQATAGVESIVTDGGHAVGDGHGGQAVAPTESIVTDGGHAVRDSHGGQATATTKHRS